MQHWQHYTWRCLTELGGSSVAVQDTASRHLIREVTSKFGKIFKLDNFADRDPFVDQPHCKSQPNCECYWCYEDQTCCVSH